MRLREVPLTFARGFAMGSADIVPGVSGGTVALVLGIYRRLIDAIRAGSSALGHFLKLDIKGGVERLRQVEWAFLLPLLAGIGTAVLALSHLIETLLEEHPVEMAGLFTGLVVGSVIVAWGLLQRRDLRSILYLLGTAVVVFVLMGLTSGTSEDSVNQLAEPALWVFFGSGAIAICSGNTNPKPPAARAPRYMTWKSFIFPSTERCIVIGDIAIRFRRVTPLREKGVKRFAMNSFRVCLRHSPPPSSR